MSDTPKKQKRSGYFKLVDVRCQYVRMFEPKPGMVDKNTGVRGPDKYQMEIRIPKDTAEGLALKAIVDAAIAEAAEAKWGAKYKELKDDKVCLKDGDAKGENLPGHWYLRVSNKEQPKLLDRDRSELTTTNGGLKKIYSGARLICIGHIWGQDYEGTSRLNGCIEAVQFYKKGEPLSSREIDVEEEFEDLSDMDDDIEDDEDEAVI